MQRRYLELYKAVCAEFPGLAADYPNEGAISRYLMPPEFVYLLLEKDERPRLVFSQYQEDEFVEIIPLPSTTKILRSWHQPNQGQLLLELYDLYPQRSVWERGLRQLQRDIENSDDPENIELVQSFGLDLIVVIDRFSLAALTILYARRCLVTIDNDIIEEFGPEILPAVFDICHELFIKDCAAPRERRTALSVEAEKILEEHHGQRIKEELGADFYEMMQSRISAVKHHFGPNLSNYTYPRQIAPGIF
jgi:hypothetical protein